MNNFQPDATLNFSPVLQCVAFFVLFGLCGANSLIISRFASHIVGTIDRIFVFAIAFLAQVIMFTAMLGLAGRLNYFLIVALLMTFFIFLNGLRSRLSRRKRSLARSTGIRPPGVSSPFLDSPGLIFLGLAVFVIASFLFVWAVVSPPPASDAFIYHLPLPTRWMQTGTILPDKFGPFRGNFHPSNPETLLLWMILPFHEDLFTNLVSWIFWLLCAFAVYSICISLRARHSGAIAAAMIWLALPLTSRTAASSEVDLFAAFFFLVSVLFLVRYRAERHVVFLLWGGLSLGIFLGSKLTALVYSLPVFALYAMLILERKLKRANNMIVFLMSAMLLSAFWYMCNFMMTGSPFSPIQLTRVFRSVSAEGVSPRQAILSPEAHSTGDMSLFLIILEMFGIYLTCVLLFSLAAAIVFNVRRRRLITTSVLLLPLVLTLLFRMIGLGGINNARFLFPAAALTCVAWSLVVPQKKSLRFIFYFITLACVAKTISENRFLLYMVFRNLWHAVAGTTGMESIVWPARWLFLLCFTGGFLIFLAFVVGRPLRRRCYLFGIVLAAVIFAIQYPGLSRYYSFSKYIWYRAPVSPGLKLAWGTLNILRPEPLNIAVAGTNLYHGFYGAGLRNRVNRFDYSPYNDDSKWIADLQAQSTHLLYVSKIHKDLIGFKYSDEEGFPMDVAVAERHPDVFVPFKDFGGVRAYIVRQP